MSSGSSNEDLQKEIININEKLKEIIFNNRRLVVFMNLPEKMRTYMIASTTPMLILITLINILEESM